MYFRELQCELNNYLPYDDRTHVVCLHQIFACGFDVVKLVYCLFLLIILRRFFCCDFSPSVVITMLFCLAITFSSTLLLSEPLEESASSLVLCGYISLLFALL